MSKTKYLYNKKKSIIYNIEKMKESFTVYENIVIFNSKRTYIVCDDITKLPEHFKSIYTPITTREYLVMFPNLS
jgi:hypothetical protein